MALLDYCECETGDDYFRIVDTVTTTASSTAPVKVLFNHLKPNSSNFYTLSYRPNVPFLNFWHSVTLALSPECQSDGMSEIKNDTLGLYGAKHWKCSHVLTLSYKGLSTYTLLLQVQIRPEIYFRRHFVAIKQRMITLWIEFDVSWTWKVLRL